MVGRKKGYEDIVKAKTGLRIDPYFSASKIRFIFDQNPDVYEKAKKRGSLIWHDG